MMLFIENLISGGVSMISNRYGKASKKNIKSYSSSKEHKYIAHLDADNLYGWGMSQNCLTKILNRWMIKKWKI